MGRGGIASRLRRSEESLRPSYRLNGVQPGSRVAECLDRARRWHLGFYRLGTLRTRTTSAVWILWDEDEEPTRYSQGDARYKVDTDLWRITGPNSVDPMKALALTPEAKNASINHQPLTEAAPTEERVMQGAESTSKTFGAKQVASRIGTDPKTFRKFLRSSASPVQAVGQGKRYDFPESELPKLAQAFKKWQDSSKNSNNGDGAVKKSEVRGRQRDEVVVEELDDALEELEEDPSEEVLTEIELELDDEEEGVELHDQDED